MNNNKLSRFLSLVLRHKPEEIDLHLDSEGWAEISTLLQKLAEHGKRSTKEQLFEVVTTNDKARFRISDDGTRIRANQGHSIDIDIGLRPVKPPAILYHGTAERFLKSIQQSGLSSRTRQHVHLSSDIATAKKVGMRHGSPAILFVEATRMFEAGFEFFQAENGVWLTKEVPLRFLDRHS